MGDENSRIYKTFFVSTSAKRSRYFDGGGMAQKIVAMNNVGGIAKAPGNTARICDR